MIQTEGAVNFTADVTVVIAATGSFSALVGQLSADVFASCAVRFVPSV